MATPLQHRPGALSRHGNAAAAQARCAEQAWQRRCSTGQVNQCMVFSGAMVTGCSPDQLRALLQEKLESSDFWSCRALAETGPQAGQLQSALLNSLAGCVPLHCWAHQQQQGTAAGVALTKVAGTTYY
jgi:hypothetical protein